MPGPPPVAGARTARWPAALGVVVIGLLLLGGFALASRTFGSSGPDHPAQWDPRLVELAAFVEQERGLFFEHAVHVDFLTDAEYTEQTTSAEDELVEEDRAELDRYAAELRALGVASGPIDLFTAFNQVSDAGTLAFYDPTDQRVRVRGTEMTVGVEVTLVHELTHVLQDQAFDLDRLNDDALDEGARVAFRSLVEGDALRVEDAYIGQLPEDDLAAYEDEYAGELAESEEATSEVPPFLGATFGAPYALGQPFVLALYNQGGNAAVNRAFDRPPDTDEHIFDPVSYLADEDATADVDLGFDDDAELLDQGPIGPTGWYLFLAERIDPKVAFDAALGWDGDDFAAVEDDGATCVRAAFVGDTERDDEQMADALDAWLDVMPGGEASIEEVRGRPVLVTCDPGEDVDLELTGRSDTSLYLPSLWGYLVADAVAGSLGPAASRCYAQTVVDGTSYADIIDPEGAAFATDEFQDRLGAAVERCA